MGSGPGVSEHGLKKDAIGFTDALVIGLASTAPAYSIAAVIGLVVVAVGVQAPAVLLASFVPIFFIAAAFYLTPHISTIVVGALATLWYVVVNALSENFLFDTLSALSLMIAFYYALSGFACVIYYRRELLQSVKNFLFIGVAPFLGAVLLAFLFVRSVIDLADPEASYSGGSVLGLGVPLVIGGTFLLLGVLLSVLWRIAHPTGYFRRRGFEVAPATE